MNPKVPECGVIRQLSSNTAGLQVVLKVAVGTRVMLRRNIDTKAGLVNGAIGTVVAISATRITINSIMPQIELVKRACMVIKNYYVYSTQFPLILAYSVTVHRCSARSGSPGNCLTNAFVKPHLLYIDTPILTTPTNAFGDIPPSRLTNVKCTATPDA